MSTIAHRRRAWSGLLVVAGLTSLAVPAVAQETFTRKVAIDGDEATGLVSGEDLRITAGQDEISIARNGTVLFDAAGVGSSTSRSGYFTQRGRDEVQSLALQQNSLPIDEIAALNGYTLLRVDAARMAPNGNAIVEGIATDGSFQLEVLVTVIGGAGQVPAVERFGFPGVCGLAVLGNGIYAEDYALNGDTVYFHGRFNDVDCQGDDLWRLLRRRPASTAASLAVEDGAVPGVANETFDRLFFGVVASEEGHGLWQGRYRDDNADLREVLLHADAAGVVSIDAVDRTIVPGTAHRSVAFGGLTFGLPASPGEAPRRGWYATARTDPDDVQEREVFYVFDTAHGPDPVMGTGSTAGPFTFASGQVQFNSQVRTALASDDVVVAVATTTGAPIDGEAPAVWRYDGSLPQDRLSVPLYQGQTVQDADGNTVGTVTDIYTVHVAQDGAIAAEVELGNSGQAILIEDRLFGTFRAPIREDVDFEARSPDGTDVRYETVGIANQFPSFPKLTGPGLDGRQSRFNANHEFVFRARVVPEGGTSVSGVFVTTIDPPPEDCDVTVRQKGPHIDIRGKKGDCTLDITIEANGDIDVRPGDPSTTVNGQSAPFNGSLGGNLVIRLGNGDHAVAVSSALGDPQATPTGKVPGNLVYAGGSGRDVISLDDVEVQGSVTIKAGTTSTTDSLTVQRSIIGRNLKFKSGGGGATAIQITESNVDGTTSLVCSAGSSRVFVEDSEIGTTKVRGSDGQDEVRLEESPVLGALTVDFRAGSQEELSVVGIADSPNLTPMGGPLKVKATKAGASKVSLADVDFAGALVKIDTGSSSTDIAFSDVAAQTVKVSTSGSAPGQTNRIAIDQLDTERSLVIRGNGTHDVDIDGGTLTEGLALNLKGGATHTLAVEDLTIPDGLLQISSRTFQITDCTVTNCNVAKGALSVRTGASDDRVTIVDCMVDGRLQISAFDGDDQVQVHRNTVKDLRLFGGAGVDTLDNGGQGANTVSGVLVEDSFP